MIDIHAHLCFSDFEKDIDDVVKMARKELAGVIVSSARYDEGLRVLELCRKNRGFLFPTIGFHPTEGDNYRDVMRLIKENRKDIAGVGEVGMDYHWENDPEKRKGQEDIFRQFIGLAKDLGKPLVIHSWDAEKECFELVRDSGVPCIFHCFSGGRNLAKEIVEEPAPL